jgi:hypothetical protein
LYPAARARIEKLEVKVKELEAEKLAAKERELELLSLIQKFQLQIELLNAKVFGKRHKHKGKNTDKDQKNGHDDKSNSSSSSSSDSNSSSDQNSSNSSRPASSYRRKIPDESEITDRQHHGVDTSESSPHANHEFGERKTVEFSEEDIILPSDINLRTVTKHTVETVFCKSCDQWLYGKDIPGQPVTIGENLPKLVSFLSVVSRFSYQQIIEHASLFYHIKLTDGLIANMLEAQAVKLRPAYENLIESILKQSGVHFDESTWKMLIERLGHYVWVMTGTDNRDAVYFFGQSRGKGVLDKMLASLKESGKKIIGISDDYNAYKSVEAFLAHALCWAHPNRKLRDLAESKTLPENTRAHCEKVYKQFNTLYKKVNLLWNADIEQSKRDKQRERLEKQFDRVAKPHSKDPPELKTYKDTLRSNKECYFVCLNYPNIPPDNNKAERAIRHLVIKRKACGGSKTQKGADVLSVLYSVLLSLHWREPEDYFGEYDKLLQMAG